MKIVIFALDSRGDVQPHVALGAGLRAAGHSVRLLASTYCRGPVVTIAGQMHAKAADLGARIPAEDGVARAVAMIEGHGRRGRG